MCACVYVNSFEDFVELLRKPEWTSLTGVTKPRSYKDPPVADYPRPGPPSGVARILSDARIAALHMNLDPSMGEVLHGLLRLACEVMRRAPSEATAFLNEGEAACKLGNGEVFQVALYEYTCHICK